MNSRLVVLSLALAGASAFVPAQSRLSLSVRHAEDAAAVAEAPAEVAEAAAEEAAPAPAPAPAPVVVPVGGNFAGMYGAFGEPGQATTSVIDPFNFRSIGTPKTAAFIRSAEVKHGRIAMMACLGWFHHFAGIHFPGMLSVKEGISFADLDAMSPIDAFFKMPKEGLYSIFGLIAVPELYAMTHKNGEFVGSGAWFDGLDYDMYFDPLGFKEASPAAIERAQLQELKNGRLAMIGIFGFICAAQVPGSVPLLNGLV